MTDLRFLSALVAAALLLMLATAGPADAQVVVQRGVNPWTGQVYRNSVRHNPWTGRTAVTHRSTNPWTGTTVRGGQVVNPWTGRTTTAGVAYNPWTGRREWGVHRSGW